MSVVVLTMGDRSAALDRALRSVRRQTVAAELVVVWNGTPPQQTDVEVDIEVSSASNLGIPGGRNRGAEVASGRILFFLDDDAAFVADDALERVVADFSADDARGAVGVRLVDERGDTASRHVPRIGRRSALRSGDVAGFLGGAVGVDREAFRSVGGYCGEFFYAMEESDLAVRLIDRGRRIWYDADVEVFHPRAEPSRHAGAIERTARNRVWYAHRNLPMIVGIVHVVVWIAITGARNVRSPGVWRAHLAGTRAGWLDRPGPREPVSWSTVARLSRLGRPPVL